MHPTLKFPLVLLLVCYSLILSGCSSIETSLSIVDIFHQADSKHVQVLYTRSKQKVSCPVGSHGCTYNILEQDLYQVILPLEESSFGERELERNSNLVRSGTRDNDYNYFKSNASVVLGNTKSQILEICTLNPDADESCSSNQQLQTENPKRSRPILSDSSNTFLWNNSLYTLPELDTADLGNKPGYQHFLNSISAIEQSDSTHATVRTYLFDDQTLLAKSNDASGANAPLGLIYRIDEDRSSPINKTFSHGENSIAVLALQKVQNEVYFLLNFYDLEDGTFNRIANDFYLYSTADNSLQEIQDPKYQEGETIWDVDNQMLYAVEIFQNSGISISARELNTL